MDDYYNCFYEPYGLRQLQRLRNRTESITRVVVVVVAVCFGLRHDCHTLSGYCKTSILRAEMPKRDFLGACRNERKPDV